MLLASVVHTGMVDTKRWPRGDRFYRPPAATPLSLSPNGHFQPPQKQWPRGQPLAIIIMAATAHWHCALAWALHRCGLELLMYDAASTGTACSVIGDAIGTRRERWSARKVNMCYKTLYFDPPSPALGHSRQCTITSHCTHTVAG